MDKYNDEKNKKLVTKKKADRIRSEDEKLKNIKKTNNAKYEREFEQGKNVNTIKGKKKKKGRKGWKIFKIVLFLIIALMIIGAGVAIGVVSKVIETTDPVDIDKLKTHKEKSYIYDSQNNQIAELKNENRVLAKYSEIPQCLVDAVVSIEDERFFTHKGVDIKRTAAAVVTYVLNGGKSDFGGSTITQQLIKNVSEDNESSWKRKIREWYRATLAETKMSKEEIFEAYVNKIYFGDGAYGVSVAANHYFNKDLKDITIAEAAVLAAAIQTPEATNPYKSDEARQKLLDRQKIVLSKMLSLGKITQEQYDEAKSQEIEFNKGDTSYQVQSYFVDEVIKQVKKDLMEEKGLSEGAANEKLYGGGLRIYATLDQNVQNAIDSAYSNEKYFYTDSKGKFMQSAMVVIEQSTGSVVGLTGGAGKKTGAFTLNRATEEPRQPGSCMKPIGAYGPAFEMGVLSPGAGIDDSQLLNGKGPKNYYAGYNGYVTVRNAIAKSMNLPAVRTYFKVDAVYAINFAKNLGLKHLVTASENKSSNDQSYSFSIGGLTKGATVLEMANAYATIANQGVYIEPKFYTKVLDSDGNEVLAKKSNAKSVMKDSTAYMLTSCLESVVKAGGTAYGYVNLGTGMAVAGKTGNTDSDKDQWFCGYTPYYTIACWNGYDYKDGATAIGRRKIGSYPYTSVALFNDVAKAINKGKPVKQFEQPDSVTTAPLCTVSGLVATDACRADPRGDKTGTDLVAKDSIPTATCNIHKMVNICNETGLVANEYCPSVTSKSFITRDGEPQVKPADWAYMVPSAQCTVHNSSNRGNNINDSTTDNKGNSSDININVYDTKKK